ncbi:hypothetical protein I314_01144 [Cryptococcus bacillisporus CA1873]|uniref:5'-deoxynucleotidase n=1 Tax=Cryptococcus bacillisporus CA1873 TaxID=1296111 RepID=A0ABR5BHS0_CRYGA|nr:hypothetical protein I314_01144 [Cryptococcus bacillisporus CA1873]|eukprot:KIR68720.1 hypothetical protein I314_01144 [Cryptococcus gattii CA1873]
MVMATKISQAEENTHSTVKEMAVNIGNDTALAADAAPVVLGAGGKPLPPPYKLTTCRSISDHMCRMALMAMMLPNSSERPLDISRCVMMALVHDLAEAYVGDITPVEGVPTHVKHQLEEQAMDTFLNEMLGGQGNKDARERFRSLWDEYEARETPESRLVKDLDRIELALQAVEYERSQDIQTLALFFKGSIPSLEHPVTRQWAATLMEERRKLWTSRGRAYEGLEDWQDIVPQDCVNNGDEDS